MNNDAIVRTSYYKYFNPKEALVPDGILNRALADLSGVTSINLGAGGGDKNEQAAQSMQFVYPFGATLSVQKPAVPVLSSGTICYPIKQALCALYSAPQLATAATSKKGSGGGKVCVLGSSHIFHDTYMDKEDNRRLLAALIRYLTDDAAQLNQIDAEDPDVAEYTHTPNIGAISSRPKACLQDSEDIPRDLSKLFDQDDEALFALDMRNVPKVIRAYDELKIKHEPLPLISPQFETPLPPLKPAVYPPRYKLVK